MPAPDLVPALRSQNQLQALRREGWTFTSLAPVTGVARQRLDALARGDQAMTSAARADRIDGVFRALSGALQAHRAAQPTPPRPAAPAPRPTPPVPPDPDDVQVLLDRGMDEDDIAAQLGCSRYQVVCAGWLSEPAIRNGRIIAAARAGIAIDDIARAYDLSSAHTAQIARGYFAAVEAIA